MHKPLQLVVAILLVAGPALLAYKGEWAFAASGAVVWMFVVWRVRIERERARRLFALEWLSQGAHSGFELMGRSDGKLGQGTVFPTLRGMERDGLVISAEGRSVPECGNRPRRYYAITRKGAAWLGRNKGT